MFLLLLLVFMMEHDIKSSVVPSGNNSLKNEHKEHYQVNRFNQLADDDRTEQHTEDFNDYGNEDTDYVEPEYNEDYFVDDEVKDVDPKTIPTEDLKGLTNNKSATQGKQTDRNNITRGDLKWFNKQRTNQSNEKEIPQRNNIPTNPSSNIPLLNAVDVPSSNGFLPNEAEVKNNSNIYSRIKNIKENANRLNIEKIIYADEKFLLLKFKLTPLNESSVQTAMHDDDGVQNNGNFGKELRRGEPKDLLGLFDSSIFDEDDSFFNSFEDSPEVYPGKPSNYERASQRRGNGKESRPYKGKHSGKSNSRSGDNYNIGKGVWIGNKYYPYHGPGFRHHRPSYHFNHDFSDEDSSDSDYSDDCSEDSYEDSNEDKDRDPGILYGKPRPGVNTAPPPTRGPGVVIYQGPGVSNIPPGGPNIPPGVPNVPPATPGRDTGILYGNPGRPGIVNTRGTGNTGNNTDVVLLVIAPQ